MQGHQRVELPEPVIEPQRRRARARGRLELVAQRLQPGKRLAGAVVLGFELGLRGREPARLGRIRRARESAGLTREQLAVAIGKTFDSVSSYEMGRSTPHVATLRAIARACGTTAADLLAGTDDEGAA